MKFRDIRFTTYLSVISILGFLAILVQASSDVDIGSWVDGALFFLIGISLFISGGYHLFFKYFKGGITADELNKIVTVIVGAASIITGILVLPIFGFELEVLRGFKIIVALIAIFVIVFEMFDRKC